MDSGKKRFVLVSIYTTEFPTKALDLKTPYEDWHNKLPIVSHLRRFGCDIYIPVFERTKLKAKMQRAIFVGYNDNTTAQYKVYCGNRLTFVATTDVRINEQSFANRDYKVKSDLVQNQLISDKGNTQLEPPNIEFTAPDSSNHASNPTMAPYESDVQVTDNLNQLTDTSNSQQDSVMTEPTLQEDPNPDSQSKETSTSHVRKSLRKRYPSFKLRSALSARIQASSDPTSYREAIKHPYSYHWKLAMANEVESLDQNKTWVLVDENAFLRSGKRLLGNKWVYKVKNGPFGKRYKARLVIKGYEQCYGIDYQETFAPVAKFITVRILFALAAYFDWEIEHMDVITAFLNPNLHEEVYMEQPEGFVVTSASGGRLVYKLLKTLYGLKQAPRAWYSDIDIFFKSLGLIRSKEDYSLYISTKANIIILLFVDDMLLLSPDKVAIRTMKEHLFRKYKMTDLGPVQQFLGLQIVRDRKALYSVYFTKIPDEQLQWSFYSNGAEYPPRKL